MPITQQFLNSLQEEPVKIDPQDTNSSRYTVNTTPHRPIVVNLFGGPCCGKSTCAAYIFSQLKMHGYSVELATEFAKDASWEHNLTALSCQPYIFGQQCYRLDRCAPEVDIIITDSPLLLSPLYNKDPAIEPAFTDFVLCKSRTYNNLNFFLWRPSAAFYCPVGRVTSFDDAVKMDSTIMQFLHLHSIDYTMVSGETIDAYDHIVEMIIETYKDLGHLSPININKEKKQ